MLISAFRSLMRTPLRSLFTLLTIAVGTASLFCMSAMTQLVPESVNQSSRQLLGADLSVQAYLEPTTMGDIRRIVPETERQAVTGAWVTLATVRSELKTSNIILKGVDPDTYPYYGREKFPDIQNLQSDEILLSAQAAGRLQIKAGDTVSLINQQDGSLNAFRVKGLVDGVQESYTDSAFWGTAYLSYSKSIELTRVPSGTVNEVYLQLNDTADTGAIKENIRKQIVGSQAADLEDKKAEVLAGTKGTLLVMQLFSLLAVAIAAVTIFNTMTIVMAGRLRDIAIMKSVGMNKPSIARYFLFEAAFLGFIGTLTGIVIGNLIGYGMSAYIAKMLVLPMEWKLYIPSVVFSFVVGITVALIAAWSPVHSAIQVSPLELLRDSGLVHKQKRLPWKTSVKLFLVICAEMGFYLHETLLAANQDGVVFKWIASFVLSMLILIFLLVFLKLFVFGYGLLYRMLGRLKTVLPMRWFLLLHNLGSDYKRNALLTITLSVGVLFVVASQLFTDNLVNAVQAQMEKQVNGNVIISAAADEEEEMNRVLEGSSGVKHYARGYELKGSFVRLGGTDAAQKFLDATADRKISYLNTTNVTIQGIDPVSSALAYTVQEGRGLTEEDNGKLSAILREDYGRDLGLRLGDRVEVRINSDVVPLKIVGFYESGVIKSEGIRVTENTLKAYGSPTRLNYYVELSARGFQEHLTNLNRSLPASAVAYSLNSSIIDSLQKTLSTQSTFFSAMALFAFLTAILMIGNQVVLSLVQKNRDVAIFKTIGLSTGRLLRSILSENLVLAFLSGIIGSFAGLVFALLALSLFVKGNVDLNLTWCIIGILLSMLTTAAVTLAASLQSLGAKPLHMLRGN
ncbi:ABC transporter substrate-binding protein [Paenibacillus sambharensis]|uniref:ABC transporter substrate-binding protein n=1 Tax=Paenibacillus sambharensis TaxID=1803190 RepID=A0A2W1L760_9BACL|nr:ABC transporter permease [Paenibacillus sambharensis]PZD94793.1 ABC transporter substrate-binding protein [Paenibacillus sambharensis]